MEQVDEPDPKNYDNMMVGQLQVTNKRLFFFYVRKFKFSRGKLQRHLMKNNAQNILAEHLPSEFVFTGLIGLVAFNAIKGYFGDNSKTEKQKRVVEVDSILNNKESFVVPVSAIKTFEKLGSSFSWVAKKHHLKIGIVFPGEESSPEGSVTNYCVYDINPINILHPIYLGVLANSIKKILL